MILRKLHTVDSTNTFLKNWLKNESLEHMTGVYAEDQTNGRGQRGNKWWTEKGKNLTFSVLVKIPDFPISRQFELNQAISLAILNILNDLNPVIPKVKFEIKWPNDIMADGKKIAGILIENSLSKGVIRHSIVGIGLNVNQTDFPIEINKATSLLLLKKQEYDVDILLNKLTQSIKRFIAKLKQDKDLKSEYIGSLYRYNKKAKYQDLNQIRFEGHICNISKEGQLEILVSDGKIRQFGYKEIVFL
jgi:BirA family biotin operon repressor/biotin-[acetyl-CoA-carboxylase] ligase